MNRRKLLTLAALMLATVTVMQLCGCAVISELQNGSTLSGLVAAVSTDLFGEGEQTYREVNVVLQRHPDYAPTEDKTAYAALLNDEERQAYRSIEESIFRITDEAVDGEEAYSLCRAKIPSLSSVQIFKVKEAVLADHPEAFWVSGDYTLGQNATDGLYVVMYSSMSAEAAASKAETLSERIRSIIREIPYDLNEYDRELAVHNIIVRDVDYDDEEAKNISNNSEAATVYGALVNGKAICTGYARTVKLLLNRVGLSCRTVKGISYGADNEAIGHMWNLVSVDKEWYHLDVTWNDPTGYLESGIPYYNYFNLTDKAISVNHEISPDYRTVSDESLENQPENAQNFYNFTLPACSSEKANFYLRNAHRIHALNADGQNVVAKALREKLTEKSEAIYFLFDDGMEPEVITDWCESVINTELSRVGSEKLEEENTWTTIKCTYVQSPEDNWCNVYIVMLRYE